MKLVVTVAAVAIAMVLPAVAGAATYTGPRAQWMTWEEVVSKMPGPAGAIHLRSGVCPDTGALACADLDGGELWLASRRPFAAAHERGHFFDARNLDNAEREQIQFLMGIPLSRPWNKKRSIDTDCVNVCPMELFADAYANCALGRSLNMRQHGWESPYGYIPKSMQAFRAVCDTIKASASPV